MFFCMIDGLELLKKAISTCCNNIKVKKKLFWTNLIENHEEQYWESMVFLNQWSIPTFCSKHISSCLYLNSVIVRFYVSMAQWHNLSACDWQMGISRSTLFLAIIYNTLHPLLLNAVTSRTEEARRVRDGQTVPWITCWSLNLRVWITWNKRDL